jgi:hypothetical protein
MADMLNFLLTVHSFRYILSDDDQVAGAGTKRWIQSSVDIDGLTADEFEELVSPKDHSFF